MIATIAVKFRDINQISEFSDEMVLVETVFITVIGGLAGTLAAIVGSSLIESYVKGMLPYCGIYPAFKPSRLSPMEAIRSSVE